MNWYLQSDENSDVILSTKIKFSRNISGFKFNLTEKNEIEQLEEKIKENIYEIGYGLKFFKLQDMDEITKQSLMEKNLITNKFIKNKNGSILINDEENICIMIGGEDHLAIQVFNYGLNLENTLNLAIELDEKLDSLLGYSKSKKYGYLTACPKNLGTGLKASVMMHLPALDYTKNIKTIFNTINNFGINIQNSNGENQSKENSNIYYISNQQTLGITEKEIIEKIRAIAQKIMEEERKARKILTKDEIEFEDIIYRDYGMLKYCRKISTKETMEVLSVIKLGTDMGIIKELTDLQVKKLYLYTRPANLQKYFKEEYTPYERDIKRAEIIKKILSNEI